MELPLNWFASTKAPREPFDHGIERRETIPDRVPIRNCSH
jgi:hypothetical protein